MAVFIPGGLIAAIRGSVGGSVFSAGSGGPIIRNRSMPINPRSPAQQGARARMAYLSQYWSSSLDDAQRAAWITYALNTAWTNKVGTSAKISGLAAFCRLNALAMQGGYDISPTAPPEYGHAGTPTFTITADAVGFAIGISEPSAPFDKDMTNSRMLWFMRGATNVGRVALSGQRRYLGTVAGDDTTAPTFPDQHASPLGFSNGQIISVSGIYLDEIGRVGHEYVTQILSATP